MKLRAAAEMRSTPSCGSCRHAAAGRGGRTAAATNSLRDRQHHRVAAAAHAAQLCCLADAVELRAGRPVRRAGRRRTRLATSQPARARQPRPRWTAPSPAQRTQRPRPTSAVAAYVRPCICLPLPCPATGAPLDLVQPEALRWKAYEPVLLLGKQRFSNVDIRIRVKVGLVWWRCMQRAMQGISGWNATRRSAHMVVLLCDLACRRTAAGAAALGCAPRPGAGVRC